MPLTRSFKETVMEDIRKNPGFRDALLSEAIQVLIGGEMEVAKNILRDYINATIGFEKLSAKVKIPRKSLMRMFGPDGNPRMNNLFAVIVALQKDAGVQLHVAAE